MYVRFKGKTLGPLTEQKVRDLVRRGQITRLHELSPDGNVWHRLEEMPSLLGERSGRTVSPAGPGGSGNGEQKRAEADAPVRGAGSGPPAAVSTPAPGVDAEPSVEWYIHLRGQTVGPQSTSTLKAKIHAGEVDAKTLVWRAGYDSWLPASQAFPDEFGRGGHPSSPSDQHGGVQVSVGGGSPDLQSLHAVLAKQRPWTLSIAVSLLALSTLGAVYFVTAMIVGAERNWIPFQGAAAVIYGLVGLIHVGVVVAGAILLLRFSTSVKSHNLSGDRSAAIVAAKRLGTYWRYWACVIIFYLVLLFGGATFMFVTLFAAADAAN